MAEKKKQLNFKVLKAGDVETVFGSRAGRELLEEYSSYYRLPRKELPQAFRRILEAGNGILLGFHWQGKTRVPVGLIHFNETPKTILTVATFVRPKFRRQDMAVKMSQHLIGFAAGKGKKIVRLSQSKRMEKLAEKMREKPRTLYRGGKAVGKAEVMAITKRGLKRDVSIKPRPRQKPKRTRVK